MSATPAVKQFYRPGRRPRLPLSCDPCRTRKLKCNRESPCQNCTTRNEETSCKYKGTNSGSTSMARDAALQHDPMQQRIDQLESLVKRLLANRQSVPPIGVIRSNDGPQPAKEPMGSPTALSASDIAPNTGITVFNGASSAYKGTDDWYDVLQEINNLRQIWSQSQDHHTESHVSPDFSTAADGASLLFGQVKEIDKLEILATLPAKHEVDKLISQFFDHKNFPITFAPIIHEPTFMREYTEHWEDPSRTSIIWLGLLFSILGIVMLSYHQFDVPSEDEGISGSLFQLYRLRTAQCLIIGDIAKCLPYTLETLRFNATAELNRREDNGRSLWIMTGVIVRAAINMGYHRETAQPSSLSALQAEYRRRVWLSVLSMDDVASFWMGFPRMVPSLYSNTLEPRNIHDWELSDETATLPASRPLTEPTPATYLIVKGRLFRALGRITDINNTQGRYSYDTVLEIDTSLQEAYQNIPSHMRVRVDEENLNSLKSKSDFSNFQLYITYHQGMCILHRRFITRGRLDPRFKISNDRCISSALALLKHQHILDPSWYRSSRTRQTLTLAAMILFLELEHRRRDQDTNVLSGDDSLLRALDISCSLWEKSKSTCDEASRVYEILVGLLSSFRTVPRPSSLQILTPEPPLEFTAFNPPFQSNVSHLSWEKDLFPVSGEMDIDWTSWDAFIDGAALEVGT